MTGLRTRRRFWRCARQIEHCSDPYDQMQRTATKQEKVENGKTSDSDNLLGARCYSGLSDIGPNSFAPGADACGRE